MSHFLFSYGTLQDESVQISVFNRKLTGFEDAITGYKLSRVAIADDEIIRISGLTDHLILIPGDDSDLIRGMVFEITGDELLRADEYEAENYQRVMVSSLSGKQVWVYVDSNEPVA